MTPYKKRLNKYIGRMAEDMQVRNFAEATIDVRIGAVLLLVEEEAATADQADQAQELPACSRDAFDRRDWQHYGHRAPQRLLGIVIAIPVAVLDGRRTTTRQGVAVAYDFSFCIHVGRYRRRCLHADYRGTPCLGTGPGY